MRAFGKPHSGGARSFRHVVLAAVILMSAGPLSASQIFHLELEEAAGMAGTVLVARVESAVGYSTEYVHRVEYTLRVLKILVGTEMPDSVIPAQYTMDLPRMISDAGEGEVWESPLVTGSGMELSVEPGDCAVVLAADRYPDIRPLNVIRMEPLGNLGRVRQVIGSGVLTEL
jgi:hypothetical protein